jgi:hypothetical protein
MEAENDDFGFDCCIWICCGLADIIIIIRNKMTKTRTKNIYKYIYIYTKGGSALSTKNHIGLNLQSKNNSLSLLPVSNSVAHTF